MVSFLFLRIIRCSLKITSESRTLSQLRNLTCVLPGNIQFSAKQQSVISKSNVNLCVATNKCFSTTLILCEESEVEETNEEMKPKKVIDPSKDRSKVIPPETSIRYLKSKAYKTTYGDEPVWVKYRRNFKGQFIPKRTRRTCIVDNVIITGNPCPICRDEYLVLHYTNVDLLKQFICPYTGEILDTRKTHICRKKLLELEIAIKIARDYGLITYEVPFRKFNYAEYYPNWKEQLN